MALYIPLPEEGISTPDTSTDNAVPRFNGTDGRTIQNSLVTIDDNGNITIPGAISGSAGPVFGVAPTADLHLSTKKYVDDEVATTITDHGLLTGLTDDDHTHYIKADGTRAFTGDISTSNAIVFTTSGQGLITDSSAKQLFIGADGGGLLNLYGGTHATKPGISESQAVTFNWFNTDGVTDYMSLDATGLSVEGTGNFTSNVTSIAPTSDLHLSTKKYVDDNLHSAVTVGDTSTIDLTLTGQQISGVVLPGGIDHGSLAGNGDDDHTIYSLVDGTRAFTGVVTGVAPTSDLHLSTKKYVDDNLHDSVTISDSATINFTLSTQEISGHVIASGVNHGALDALTTGDPHTQYPLLIGRTGGQTLIGGTASGNDLTLQSTSNATRGTIFFGDSGFNEASSRLGIGDNTPSYKLDVYENAGATYAAKFFNDGNAAARGGITIQCGLDAGAGSSDTTRYANCLDGDGDTIGFIAESNHIFALTDICDEKVKENIVDTQVDALGIVNGFVMKDYDKVGLKKKYKSPKRCDFIAQNCKSVFPEMVVDQVEEEGLLYINRSAVISLLVKAVQELAAEIEELKKN